MQCHERINWLNFQQSQDFFYQMFVSLEFKLGWNVNDNLWWKKKEMFPFQIKLRVNNQNWNEFVIAILNKSNQTMRQIKLIKWILLVIHVLKTYFHWKKIRYITILMSLQAEKWILSTENLHSFSTLQNMFQNRSSKMLMKKSVTAMEARSNFVQQHLHKVTLI